MAKVVDLMLLVLLLLVTMVQEVELMMEVISPEEILGNTNKVNIQLVNSLVKMISRIAHKMKTMESRRAGLGIEAIGKPYRGRERTRLHIMMSYFQGVLNL
ncbi:hypothetical protein CK203_091316 [Vitis vinifera]|uniref:Uncharacterized protein n=1 Tax=Vitis vinifera TaxID=29760 RepID=A0A438CLG1_VITVI|nr:hypothetical protein CK203_091316 [Vitis vinifera]